MTNNERIMKNVNVIMSMERTWMLFIAAISASTMLLSCSSYDEKQVAQTKEEELTLKSEEGYIPWGFDELSYPIYTSGILDAFVEEGREVEQCVVADLDMDGINDILLSCTIPDSFDPEDIHSFELNTMLLKGTGDGTYQRIAENEKANYCSSYDMSAAITAGEGWFQFTRARGTAGGYVYSYFFEYDREKKDWFLSTYYNNNYGYIEEGRSVVQTSDNFGTISFCDFNPLLLWNNDETEGTVIGEEISVDETDFKILVNTCYITLEDKEKEYKINKMITEHAQTMIELFRAFDTQLDIKIQGSFTYETPQVISIEYSLWGTIGKDEIEYSGINRKYITVMFDIETARQIRLAEIIDIDKLYKIMKQQEPIYGMFSSETAWNIFNDMEPEECIALLKTADSLEAALGVENTGIFSAVYEKSICLYFQPEFIGKDPHFEEPKLFISLENVLPEIKLDYWKLPEDKLSRIQWMG